MIHVLAFVSIKAGMRDKALEVYRVLVPKVILLESFLSFLGLGVQEPMTSWGTLIAEGATGMQYVPWLLIFPSIFFVVTLFALNFIGDGLRDALDPKDR